MWRPWRQGRVIPPRSGGVRSPQAGALQRSDPADGRWGDAIGIILTMWRHGPGRTPGATSLRRSRGSGLRHRSAGVPSHPPTIDYYRGYAPVWVKRGRPRLPCGQHAAGDPAPRESRWVIYQLAGGVSPGRSVSSRSSAGGGTRAAAVKSKMRATRHSSAAGAKKYNVAGYGRP